MGEHEHELTVTPADRDELAHGLGEVDGGGDERERAGDDEHEHERQGADDDEHEHEQASAAERELADLSAPAPMSERELERRAQTLERSFQRHAARVGELYGDEAVRLVECPLCQDQHKGFVHLDWAGRVPDEVQEAVMVYFGIAREREYPQDPGTNTCQVCAGEGKVRTGSNVPAYKVRECPNCNGAGYMPPPSQLPPSTGMAVVDGAASIVLEALAPAEERDSWGEPRILPDGRQNPNYGRMPQYKIPVEPWGSTANLNALDAV